MKTRIPRSHRYKPNLVRQDPHAIGRIEIRRRCQGGDQQVV